MSELLIDFRFSCYTSKGEPNLNWAIQAYFIEICNAHNVNPDTQKTYLSDYLNTICPSIQPNIRIQDYDEAAINKLVKTLYESKEVRFKLS